jgi:hypothetical protein
MTEKHESPEEVQLRLHHEKECRRIAELIKSELGEGRGFVLVTGTCGGGPGASFSSTAYVSSVEREDSARWLTELIDHWRETGGSVTEPSVQTATKIREHVFALRGEATERLLHGARCSVRDAESAFRLKDQHQSGVLALKLACEALALFDRVIRSMNQEKRG